LASRSCIDGPGVAGQACADGRERLRQVGDRVVALPHGPVPGRAARPQPHPADALLAGLDQVQPLSPDLDGEATHLADRLGAALEQVRTVLDEPVGALASAGLLVGREHERDGALRHDAGPLTGTHHRQQHGVEVLHVDRAAAPQVAVLDLAGERVDRPVGGLRRDDVEVAVHEETVAAGGLVAPARHDAASTISDSMPTSASRAATCSAALRSPGPLPSP
jgi:hypothetical protein